ncbi:MAG: hypothetical protein AB2L24_13735 [Mangrovibacterium sp.]
MDLSKEIIKQGYQSQNKSKRVEREQISGEIDKVNERLAKARELLLADSIGPIDYKEIKLECESKLVRLEAKLEEQTSETTEPANK